MASYCPNHPSHPCHQQPPPLPTASAHCYCNHPPYSCPPPPPSTDQLLQAIASLLGQFDPVPPHLYTQCDQSEAYRFLNQSKYHKYSSKNRLRQHEQHAPSAIASLLCRIEALESSLHYFSSSSSHGCRPSLNYSLRDTAARVIQTHFRAFLVRRSRTLRQLKELGCIKSRFNALKSLLSNAAQVDYAALSREAMDLLLQLDSIECCDPMVRDGKGSINRDLGHFLDSIEGVAVKKHLRLVKATKNARFGQNLDKSRVLNSKHGVLGRDQRRLLENLRGRVDRISRLCKLSAEEEGDVKSEGILHIIDDNDDDDYPSIVIRRRKGASPTNNGVFVQRQEVQHQPRTKKSVSFAESGSVSKIYSNTYEPALSEDATCLDGSSSSDEQEEILENIRSEVEDVLDCSRGAEVDEEAILDNGGSAQSSDGDKSSKRHLKNDCKNEGKVIFTAPLPLKMETRGDLTKSKGVRILT